MLPLLSQITALARLPRRLQPQHIVQTRSARHQPRNLARMHHIQHRDHTEHQRRIKHIQPDLVPQEIAVVALDVLDDAEDAADHDERARGEEDEGVFAPGNAGFGAGLREGCGVAVQAKVEDNGEDDEPAEEEELDREPADDDPRASGFGVGFLLG